MRGGRILDTSRKVRRFSRRFLWKQQTLLKQIHEEWDLYSHYDDVNFQDKTAVLKAKIQIGATPMKLLPEAFGLLAEAVFRVKGLWFHDEQLLAGIALAKGMMVEQATGEGKTLTATLPAYLHGLFGKGVHIITVNDYLAQRDAEEMGGIYEFLGLTCGCVLNQMDGLSKKQAYACDITYVTNSEVGFDYLRDNMVLDLQAKVQRSYAYAIVDEADSIFIDEARTPLIISGQAESPMDLYQLCDMAVQKLVRGELSGELTKLDILNGNHVTETGDYIVQEKEKSVHLTEAGTKKLESILGLSNFSDPKHADLQHHINMALKAHALYHADQEYVVQDGAVEIVDTFTGRILPGRRYADGLHQAIEAKEHVEIQNESRTLATITYQSFFQKYPLLAGMTGTAATEAQEFFDIYGLKTVVVPTHRDVIREDLDDAVYLTKKEKYAAIVGEVAGCYFGTHQPVLLGTPNIEVSEILSKMLMEKGIVHEVLNAKNHAREAEIIAKAGEAGRVTVATNMAGRGTDIRLDADAGKAGGLFVIGSERHEARRIDNQLRGRSGRQGDPGKSRFYLSLEDDVMRLFAPERMMGVLQNLRTDANAPISHSSLSKTIRQAQYKIEGNNFGIRKNLVEYEDVNSKQRDLIYGQRDRILSGSSMDVLVCELLDSLADSCEGASKEEQRKLGELVGLPVAFSDMRSGFHKMYEQFRSQFDHVTFERLVRKILLMVLDRHWMQHLDNLELLKQDIALIGYGQKHPVVEYRVRAYELFDAMLVSVRNETLQRLFSVQVELVLDGDVSETHVILPVSADGASVSQTSRHVLLGGRPEDSGMMAQVHAEDGAGGTVPKET